MEGLSLIHPKPTDRDSADKSRDLVIEDFEMSGPPPEYARSGSLAILAQWLVRHWISEQKNRAASAYLTAGVSCSRRLKRQTGVLNPCQKGGLPS